MPPAPTAISFSFNNAPVTIALPKPGDDTIDSVFIVGLPKAGSTLLNNLMRPLCTRAGLSPFGLANELQRLGLALKDCPPEVVQLYQPKGYAYAGYRGLTPEYPLPGFAANRTVLLVRDPRDMLVSLYFSKAYSHRPPGTVASDSLAKAFAAERASALSQDIDSYVLGTANHYARIYAATEAALAGLSYRSWRYEDVIFDKLKWANEMLAYLGLDVPANAVQNVVDSNDIRPAEEDVGKHVRRVTPGDHREKLKPETITRLNETFDKVLSRYNYV